MNGVQSEALHVSRGGAGDRLLVLLHGLGANSSVWTRMLSSIDVFWPGRWLAPDFRGHGRSPASLPYDFATHAADVAALVVDEQPGTVVVVGHSFGGVVGALLATGRFGPQVAQLYAFGVKLNWTADEIAKSHDLARKPARTFATREEAIDRYLKVSGLYGLAEANSDEAAAGVIDVSEGYQVRLDPRVYGAVGPSIRDIFSSVRVPFRLAAGAADPMVSAADMHAIDKNAVVFPGAGHSVHFEQPEMLWDSIANELKVAR